MEDNASAVSPREMHGHLGEVYERIGALGDRLNETKVEVERRFGRLEKLVLALGVAVAVPKLGGPSIKDVVSAVGGF